MLIGADQNLQSAWCKSQVVSAKRTQLSSLLVVSKSATDYWLELYDHASAATGEPLELPLSGGSIVSLAWAPGKQFVNGVFVRAVDAQGGTLIGTDDIKVTAEFADNAIRT